MIGPDRDGVLTDQDRQQDGRGFERRHDQRQERRRYHAKPGKSALAQPKQSHGGNGQKIEQRIGNHERPRAWRSGGGCDIDQSARSGASFVMHGGTVSRHGLQRPPSEGQSDTRLEDESSKAAFEGRVGHDHLRERRRTANGRPYEPLSRGLCALAARPAGLLGGSGRRTSTGSKSRRRYSIPRPASTAAGFPAASATPASMPSTATSMPGAASRRRSSTIRRSPARSAPSPITGC